MSDKDKYELATIIQVLESTPMPDVDEPSFPSEHHKQLYRDLVARMEAEATVLPGMSTTVGLMIRRLVRDYVWGVVADQAVDGGTTVEINSARDMERDRRMMNLLKMLLDQAARSDLEHALRTEFVLGLITEAMKVIDAELEDQVVRIRIKELLKRSFITYTDSVQGRIGR